jgi:hypothetical protein
LGMDFLGLEPNIGRQMMHKRDIIHTKTSGRIQTEVLYRKLQDWIGYNVLSHYT